MSLETCRDTISQSPRPRNNLRPAELKRRMDCIKAYMDNIPILWDSEKVYQDLKNILLRGRWMK